MYFSSRSEAGERLAQLLMAYRYEDVALLALSDGGVVVGAQIAAKLHCPLMLLLTGNIILPGENDVMGVIDQKGGFTYNDMYSAGELESFEAEYHTLIEQQKMVQLRGMHALLGDGGILDESIAANRIIIIVSDGMQNGTSLLAALNFLKPVSYKKLIVALPLATVKAIDAVHLLADESHILQTMRESFEVDHYFEKSDVPEHGSVVEILNTAMLHWK